MQLQKYAKKAFCVIGKAGSSLAGDGFVQRLWEEANAHFGEVQPLAKQDENGNLAGIWGIMTDFSRQFMPWEENFSKGLYLAGVECDECAQAPEEWEKWCVPGFEYLCAACDEKNVFAAVIQYMKENDIALVGAVQDYTCPQTGKNYMLFPIRRL